MSVYGSANANRVVKLAGTILFAAISMWAGICAARADSARPAGCQPISPDRIPYHQPFLLNDPRSGLMLYVESDGRHMAAIAKDGKIVWHRNLFDDPQKLEIVLPPIQIIGEPPVPESEWRQKEADYVDSLAIDRIGIVSDCSIPEIDNGRGKALFHGHYIRAGSSTHIFYLLDAKTGDFVVEEVN